MVFASKSNLMFLNCSKKSIHKQLLNDCKGKTFFNTNSGVFILFEKNQRL